MFIAGRTVLFCHTICQLKRRSVICPFVVQSYKVIHVDFWISWKENPNKFILVCDMYQGPTAFQSSCSTWTRMNFCQLSEKSVWISCLVINFLLLLQVGDCSISFHDPSSSLRDSVELIYPAVCQYLHCCCTSTLLLAEPNDCRVCCKVPARETLKLYKAGISIFYDAMHVYC